MSKPVSRFLNERELAALVWIGDIMLPEDDAFPSFSQTGCIRFVDDLLLYMSSGDRKSLKALLKVLSYFPNIGLRTLLWLVSRASRLPSALGAPFRLMELGLKGLVMSLYYSNKTSPDYTGRRPFDVIGFALRINARSKNSRS